MLPSEASANNSIYRSADRVPERHAASDTTAVSGPLVWITNGRRSAVIAMLGSSLRMLQFRLGMDGLCRSTKQVGLSFAPARIRVGPNTCFSTAAAAAAAAGASLLLLLLLAYLLLVGPARCFFFFLPTLLQKLLGDGCCTEASEKFRVRPRYDYETKHVSRDSKMCCCCCRFCCGAPTTDERIHATVLHDASQINYRRY